MSIKYVPKGDGWKEAILKHKVPKTVSTLILRPQEGFELKQARPAELMAALHQAAHLTEAEAQATSLSIQGYKNIAVIKTSKETAAAKIDKINAVMFGDRVRAVCTYIQPPENSCKGVIHQIRAGTTSEDLMTHLKAEGFTILNARMMGRTETALITFQGTHIPRTVLYRQGEYRCRPHHPKAQFCTTCFALGHRADVCPRAGTHRCRLCGTQLQSSDQEHICNPGCVNCGKDHPADSPQCETRRKADKAVTHAAYLKRLRIREQADRDLNKQVRINDKTHSETSQSLQEKHRPRSKSRGRSTSRGRRRSHSRSRTGSSNRNTGRSQSHGRRPSPPPAQKVSQPSRFERGAQCDKAAADYRQALIRSKPPSNIALSPAPHTHEPNDMDTEAPTINNGTTSSQTVPPQSSSTSPQPLAEEPQLKRARDETPQEDSSHPKQNTEQRLAALESKMDLILSRLATPPAPPQIEALSGAIDRLTQQMDTILARLAKLEAESASSKRHGSVRSRPYSIPGTSDE